MELREILFDPLIFEIKWNNSCGARDIISKHTESEVVQHLLSMGLNLL